MNVILFGVILIINLLCGKLTANHSFDYLIFTQRWIPSSCIEYEEKNSSSHHDCILPQNYKIWAIHGLWPTQNNHMGPFFCNRSMVFDIDKLKPIELDLITKWPNIEKGKDVASLWQHEWDKHGTCAAQLQPLDDEFKYFNTTLKFFKMFNVQNILTSVNILPQSNTGVSVSDLFHIFKDGFGKVPQIHCIHEIKTNLPYLSEIRLCLNKDLELIDCTDGVHDDVGVSKLTNCPLNEKIIYPDSIGDDAELGNNEL